MWTYRRLVRVSWRQHKTNAWILEQLRTKPMPVKQMRKRKMKHEKDIEEWARTNIGEATRMAERRDMWCSCHRRHSSSTLSHLNREREKITRGHNYTLVKKQNRLDVRTYSFSKRTINVWNKLSTDCVHASSVCSITK